MYKAVSQWKIVYQIHILLINICFKCFLMKDKLEFHPVVNKQFSYLAGHVFASSKIFYIGIQVAGVTKLLYMDHTLNWNLLSFITTN